MKANDNRFPTPKKLKRIVKKTVDTIISNVIVPIIENLSLIKFKGSHVFYRF